MYAEFEPLHKQIVANKTALSPEHKLRDDMQGAWRAVAIVVVGASPNVPIGEKLNVWREWRQNPDNYATTGDTPFIESVVQLARYKKDSLPAVQQCAFEPARAAANRFAECNLVDQLLHENRDNHLAQAFTALADLVDPALFGDIESAAWNPLDQSGVPRLEGFVCCSPDKMDSVMAMLQGSFDDTIAQPNKGALMKLASAEFRMEGEDLAAAFGAQEVRVETLNHGKPVGFFDACPHMDAHDLCLRVVYLSLKVFREVLGVKECQIMKSVGQAKVQFEWQDRVANTVIALRVSCSILAEFLGSPAFEPLEVLEMPTTLPLVRMRNWSGLATRFAGAVVQYLSVQVAGMIDKEACALKALTPSCHSLLVADADGFDREELGHIVKAVTPDRMKAGIILVHKGISHLASFAKSANLPGGTKHEAIAGTIASAKASMADAKVSLALRTCGQLLLSTTTPKRKDIDQVLASIAKLSVAVPDCIVRACKDLTTA